MNLLTPPPQTPAWRQLSAHPANMNKYLLALRRVIHSAVSFPSTVESTMAANPLRHGGVEIDDESSELGRMWREALLNYKRECGVDLAKSKWNISTIEADANQQLDQFKAYRHDDGIADRLGTLCTETRTLSKKSPRTSAMPRVLPSRRAPL